MGLPPFSPDSAMVIDGGRWSWEKLSFWICRSTKVRDLGFLENHRGRGCSSEALNFIETRLFLSNSWQASSKFGSEYQVTSHTACKS
jgi:hypothetical protein